MSQEATQEKLQKILEKLENCEKILSERANEPAAKQLDGHEDIPDDGSFEKRMNIFVMVMNVLAALLTYGCYLYHPPLFPVFFGLFFIFLILAVGLAIDEYLLPARTFRRISTNATAISIFWVSIIYLAVSGVQIGTSIISDPFGGEEGRRSGAAYEAKVEDQVSTGLYTQTHQQETQKKAVGSSATNTTTSSSGSQG